MHLEDRKCNEEARQIHPKATCIYGNLYVQATYIQGNHMYEQLVRMNNLYVWATYIGLVSISKLCIGATCAYG